MKIPQVAIVDYGLGNLFSVARACEQAGMHPVITSSSEALASPETDAVILPGVGAFGDAMTSLKKMGLVEPLRALASTRKPIIGICLGMQLLLSKSDELGEHEGLGIIDGLVRGFGTGDRILSSGTSDQLIKIPQVGWNRVFVTKARTNGWNEIGETETFMEGLPEGVFMYFVHSYIVEPTDQAVITGQTRYGGLEFCSAFRSGSVFGFQFHPERSGEHGLTLYRNLASWLSLDNH